MRGNFGIREGFLSLAILSLLPLAAQASNAAQQKLPPEAISQLPFGAYPHVDTLQAPQPRENDTLRDDMQDLSQRIRSTVKTVAAHRNFTCFGSPCLVQAFPLLYTKFDSGFFGGIRAKMTDISRTRPYLYSVETSLVRSDSHQWMADLSFDFPEIQSLPLDPRLKIRLSDARSTETRYFGTGPTFEKDPDLRDDDYRYAQASSGFQTSLVIPLFELQNQKFSIFSSFGTRTVSPGLYGPAATSKIAHDKPLGWEGGVSSHAGVGVLLDSRDREILSRQGWALEVSAEFAGPPLGRYTFNRVSLVDRRYFSSGVVTLGHRLTLDSISGQAPFWELTSVGGIDPITDVTGSTIMKGYPGGRFHEKLKIIESLELRWQLANRRVFGQLCQITLIPAAGDIGRFSNFNAISGSLGSKFLFNRTFLIQTYASLSPAGRSVALSFGQEY